MFCHGKQTVCVPWQNIRNTTWHERGKQNFTRYRWSYMLTNCSHFSGQGSYYGYTHAWTKLQTKVMSWIIWRLWGCMALTWSKLNNCVWFVSSVSSLPLSVMVRGCHACPNLSRLRSGFLSRRWALAVGPSSTAGWHETSLRGIFKCAHLKFMVHGYKQAYTRISAMQSHPNNNLSTK